MRSIRGALSAGGEPLAFGVVSTPPSKERRADLVGLATQQRVELSYSTY
jgi:hypothetical protein